MPTPAHRAALEGPRLLKPPSHEEAAGDARRTATGGWVVRLTDTPLDLDNPAHLEVLVRAYERLSTIGGRANSH